MVSKAEHSRTKILAAAMAVMERDGARALTLDKVAREAGVSKGGLTHHFKSKQELFLGLFDLVVGVLKKHLEEQLALEPDEGVPGRVTRAYMRVNLETIRNGEAESMRGLIDMMLADPGLVEKRRHELLGLHDRLENDGLDPVQAMALAAASDGCWMNVLLGFYGPSDPRIVTVHEYLFALSRQPMWAVEGAV
jgi:AcrR family transcriptional regulator